MLCHDDSIDIITASITLDISMYLDTNFQLLHTGNYQQHKKWFTENAFVYMIYVGYSR